jgi:hypothetical protein
MLDDQEEATMSVSYEALPADWAARIAGATSIAKICEALEIGIAQLIAWRQANVEFNEACRRTY